MTTKTAAKAKSEAKVRAVIDGMTAKVIADIEAGIADPTGWQAPWHRIMAGAVNATTKRAYSGGNMMVLAFSGYAGPFATYRQWEGIGATVRKGEKGTPILVPIPVRFDRERKDGTTESVAFTRFRVAYVFAAEQVDGYAPDNPDALTAPRIEAAQATIDAWSAVVPIEHGGNAAFYSPTYDRITLPPFEQFATAEGYYGTAFHEAAHSTGHASRLDRDVSEYGTDTAVRAHEELVAELAAAFLAGQHGITSTAANHGNYLANWLTAMKADPDYLWRVASEASKAAALVMGAAESK
jgi:antirestriction protein ArdC